MIIQTERLQLRPFTLGDAEEYFKIVSSSQDIQEFVPFAYESTVDEIRQAISECYSVGNFKDDFYLIIEEMISHKIIGAIIAVRIFGKNLDLSILLGRDFRHKGFMFEAMNGFINYLKGTNYSYLSLCINNKNIASQNLAHKLGAVKVGEIKGKYTQYFIDL